MKVEAYITHFKAGFGKFFKRKFEKPDIIRFKFYLAVVRKKFFEKAQESFAREPALFMASFGPWVAEVDIYGFERFFVEHSGKRCRVAADEAHIGKLRLFYLFGSEDCNVAHLFNRKKSNVGVAFSHFRDESAFAAAYLRTKMRISGEKLRKSELLRVGLIEFYVKVFASFKSCIAVFLFSDTHIKKFL